MKSPEPVPSFHNLIEWLIIATVRDELQWETTADREDIRAPLGGGHVLLMRFPVVPPGSYSADASPGKYTISFLDQEGLVLERFYSVTDQEVTEASRLYTLLRRLILNLETSFSLMLKDLRKKANQSA